MKVFYGNDAIREIILGYVNDINENIIITDVQFNSIYYPEPVLIVYKNNEYQQMLNIWEARRDRNKLTNYIQIPFYKDDLIAKINQLISSSSYI